MIFFSVRLFPDLDELLQPLSNEASSAAKGRVFGEVRVESGKLVLKINVLENFYQIKKLTEMKIFGRVDCCHQF